MGETLADLLDALERNVAPGTLLFDRGVAVTAESFRAEVARIAAGLSAIGIKPGDRVAVWLPNVPAWLATMFAVARLGAVVVSINTRFRSLDLTPILRRSQPRALLYWPGFHGVDFQAILAGCDRSTLASLAFLIAYTETDATSVERSDTGVHGIPWLDFHALPAGARAEDVGSPSAPCILFSTSGTTKEPKLVVHDQATLVRHARNVAAAWRLGVGSAVCLVPPLCGVYGFCTAFAALAGGAPLWMRPVWDAVAAADDIARGHCTHITASDDAYSQLLFARAGTVPFPSVGYAGYAPFNPALADIVTRAGQRGLRLSGLYGTSEVQALFSVRAGDAEADQRSLAGGYPVDANARVRARDPAADVVLPHGAVGELEIFAPASRMVAYLDDEAATAAAVTSDGWYRTGDLGLTNADGSFVYLSRAGDSLRLGGFLVSAIEIENAVVEAGGVKACQVVAVARENEGPRAVAFVIPDEGCAVDEARLAADLRARLASYKVPVRFFAIDAFPVTASANGTKIRRDALRQRALELLQTQSIDEE